MNTDLNDMESISDVYFLDELSEFVKTLPVESAASNQRYDTKLAYMNSIHGEVKKQHPKWRPEHTDIVKVEAVTSPKGKYLNTIYTFNSQRSED